MTMSATKHCPICGLDLLINAFNAKRRECRQCSRWLKTLSRYGISKDQYFEKLTRQNGHCAICPYVPKPGEVLAIDHWHGCCPTDQTCGNCLRDLLCDWCNRGLGYFKENVDVLRNAGEYLAKWKN